MELGAPNRSGGRMEPEAPDRSNGRMELEAPDRIGTRLDPGATDRGHVVRAKVARGQRLDRDDGRWLLAGAPLLELGALAQGARFARIPERRVTFVIDTNPNYTNVCITDCQFCAFYRKPGHPEAYTLTVDEVLTRIESAASRGA